MFLSLFIIENSSKIVILHPKIIGMAAKQKFKLEYLLRPSSRNVLWNYISTPAGYEKWLADEVIADGDIFTFVWGEDEIKKATMLVCRPLSHIRFRWLDDKTEKTYFEIRMKECELTGEQVIEITDFAGSEEIEDLKELWNSEVEILKRISGM